MPEAFPPTVAEREAELVALQNAFDEYIASSRELEEELDAELEKVSAVIEKNLCFALNLSRFTCWSRNVRSRAVFLPCPFFL